MGGLGLERTLEIILGIRIRRLVVMDHLHNLEEVILAEFLKSVGQSIHVHLLRVSPAASSNHASELTFLSVFFFFFDPSSPPAALFDFTPFSSPGTGPDSRSAARRFALGFLNVCNNQLSIRQGSRHNKLTIGCFAS